MAWPEVAFIGRHDFIIRRVAQSGDLRAYNVRVTDHERAPRRLDAETVALVTDDRDLRERYPHLPTLCHQRLGLDGRHLGKWSVMLNRVGLGRARPIEPFTGQVSDDAEVQQICTLFLLLCIERSLLLEKSVVSRAERAMIKFVLRQLDELLVAGVTDRLVRAAIRASIDSIRVEMETSSADRVIIRRSLNRLQSVGIADLLAAKGADSVEFAGLLRSFRVC